MARSTHTMRSRIFTGITSILLLVIAVFSTVNTILRYNALKKDIFTSMELIASNVAWELDEEIYQLALLSQRLTFSAQLRESILETMPGSTGAELYRLETDLNDLAYSICGPEPTFFHMNIITDDGYQYAFGQEFGYTRLEERPQEYDWYAEAIRLDGKALVVPLHTRQIGDREVEVVSVCRGFGLLVGSSARAVVEVMLDYDSLAEIVSRAVSYSEGNSGRDDVYVLDGNGNVVFSSEYIGNDAQRYFQLIGNAKDGEVTHNPRTGEDEFFFCSDAEYANWSVVVAPRTEVLNYLFTQLIASMIGEMLLMIAVAAIISMLLSHRFSVPLLRLCACVDSCDLDHLDANLQRHKPSGVSEIDQLGSAFNQMTDRLKRSLNQVVELKNAEIHAKMLALQAQMNPHFLYNTLAVINIMVEDGKTQAVQTACRNLSDMLEYISSKELAWVPLRQELQHAQNYMDLMQMRYQGEIDFTVSVEEAAMDVMAPKLVIQPLVENAIKHVAEKDPTWKVGIRICIDDGFWKVMVWDNGNGFDPENLRALREKMRILKSGGRIPQLKLHGMGIMNIFLRLMLAYGDDMIFWIDSRVGEGSCVTIGGKIR